MVDSPGSRRNDVRQSLLVEQRLPNDVYEVEIPASSLRVEAAEVERTLGYPRGMTPAHLRPKIDDVLAGFRQHCTVGAGYRVVDVRSDPTRPAGLYADGQFFHMHAIVTGLLKKAENLAFFLCTIGSGVETWTDEMNDSGDLVGAFLVDTVASLAVESATNMLHDHIGQSMRRHGMNITNRYSPGYCDWSVAEQRLLFALFPAKFCGITLLESALMVPIKSVSGVIGLGRGVKWVRYRCDACGMKDCTYRSVRKAVSKKKASPSPSERSEP